MTVYLCDANVWVALSIEGHIHHAVSRSWFAQTGEGDSVMFCQATKQSLLRLLTIRSVWQPYGRDPLTCLDAWGVYDALMSDPRVEFASVQQLRLGEIWRTLTSRDSASPNLWMDAYLAAFAIAEGWRLVSLDSAFAQFPGLDLLLLTN